MQISLETRELLCSFSFLLIVAVCFVVLFFRSRFAAAAYLNLKTSFLLLYVL